MVYSITMSSSSSSSSKRQKQPTKSKQANPSFSSSSSNIHSTTTINRIINDDEKDAEEYDIPDIVCKVQVFDIDFHPVEDILAVGLVDGNVQFYSYGAGSMEQIMELPLHCDTHGSIRSVRFNEEGSSLFTGGSDRNIRQINTDGNLIWERLDAHSSAINVLCPFADHMLVSGDDDGGIRIWDTRTAKNNAPVSFNVQEDVITSLYVNMDKATLVSTSCDGTLGIYDLRKIKLQHRTEQMEDEFLSLTVIKNNDDVVVGTQEGILLSWEWGQWNKGPSSKFKGHPESLDAILKVDEDTIITGSSDGIVRLITIQPNKLVGIIGEHADFPIERLAWSRDRRYIGSVSHDDHIKFWDVNYLYENDDENENDNNSTTVSSTGNKKDKPSPFVALAALALPNDDDDDDEDNDDEDDDEDDFFTDDDDGMEDTHHHRSSNTHSGNGKTSTTKKGLQKGTLKKGGNNKKKSNAFFDDLEDDDDD